MDAVAKSGLRALVVDDEKNIRTTLAICLEGLGCEAKAVGSGEAALVAQQVRAFDLAFVDLRLGTESGLDLIPKLLESSPQLAIVVITAYATIDSAVQAIKRGAWDYLAKPFTPAQIRLLVDRCAQRVQTAHRLADLESMLASAAPDVDLSTESPKMRATLQMLDRAAASDAPVLLRGETGTGKTVLARALHDRSARARKSFGVINCPTLSEELLASELFGHARGAFTGAVRDQPGRVEAADGGTLFLDEVGEIAAGLQAKLLRFLQDKQYERVGESRTRTADVRVVTATNRDLEADLRAGRFREDLLYRLNVVEVLVPPLRERSEDIVPMARRFLRFFAFNLGRQNPELSPASEELLRGYPWPGNVRELRNTLERALILWPASLLEPEAFPERMREGKPAGPQVGGDWTLEALEKEHVQKVLARTKTLEAAAAVLGIDASTLWRKRKKYDEGGGAGGG
ncbi:MAG: sigma-54 dependent transcriptional regulator [Myxococcales bacterium]